MPSKGLLSCIQQKSEIFAKEYEVLNVVDWVFGAGFLPLACQSDVHWCTCTV